jgi:acetolactate synthase I/II/III large subunit
MKASTYIFDQLSAQGVERVFFVPGGGAMYLVDALGQHPDIEAVAMVHEQAAVIAAEYDARMRQGLGVALVTCGPGATNAMTGLAGAWIESSPVLVISGQAKSTDINKPINVRQQGVQGLTIRNVVAPITKYAHSFTDVSEVPASVERAIQSALSGRKGPVWLDVPLDIQSAELTDMRPVSVVSERQRDDMPELKDALDLIRKAERPMFVIGHGVRIAGAAEDFRQLSDELQIPACFTWNAMDLLPAEDVANIGRPGTVGLRAANIALQNCDLMISVGCRLDNIVTSYNKQTFARSAKKLVVDVDKEELKGHGDYADLAICQDAKIFLRALNDQLSAGDLAMTDEWTAYTTSLKTRFSSAYENRVLSQSDEIGHYELADLFSEILPPAQDIVIGSSGMAIEIIFSRLANKAGQRLMLTSGLGAMGYGIPAAIGTSFNSAAKGRQTILIESDGSFWFNCQELNVIKTRQSPIKMFILNNDGYASIRASGKVHFEGRNFGGEADTGLQLGDICAMAESVGIPARRVSARDELEAAIKETLAIEGPALCEIMLNRDEGLFPKVGTVLDPQGKLVSLPMEDMLPLLDLEDLQSVMLVPLAEASLQSRKA